MEKKEIKNVIDKVNELLKVNDEWEKRYEGYLEDIDAKMSENIRCRKLFRVTSPFYVYSSISKAKKSKCEYDLRYKGQSIGSINIDENDHVLFTTTNNGFFQTLACDNVLWNSDIAKKVRNEFKNLADDTKTKSPEHQAENQILVEFAKSKSYDKSLVHIQPVKINKQFFQMPTPLKASTRDIEYAKQYGGGIDIMARIRVKGYASNKNNRLVIFELKDENTKKEPVDKVILQAVAYATFIGNLIQKQSGWLKKFGINGDPKEIKEIYAATLMPKNGTIGSFEGWEFPVCGDIKLKLHTLYFERQKEAGFDFSGSLIHEMV